MVDGYETTSEMACFQHARHDGAGESTLASNAIEFYELMTLGYRAVSFDLAVI